MSTSSQPSFQVSPPVKRNSTLAIASLILGILGWTFLPLAGSLIAVITGHMAKSEIKESEGQLAGDGMASAGLILGYTAIALGLCLCILFMLAPAALWFYGDQIIDILP